MNVHLAPARPPVRHRKLPLDRRLIAEDASLSLAFRPLEAHGGPNDPEVLESVSVGAGPERHRESPRVANAPRSRKTPSLRSSHTPILSTDASDHRASVRSSATTKSPATVFLMAVPLLSGTLTRRTVGRRSQGRTRAERGLVEATTYGSTRTGRAFNYVPRVPRGSRCRSSYLPTVLRVVTTTLQRLQDWYGNHREVRRPRSSRVRMA